MYRSDHVGTCSNQVSLEQHGMTPVLGLRTTHPEMAAWITIVLLRTTMIPYSFLTAPEHLADWALAPTCGVARVWQVRFRSQANDQAKSYRLRGQCTNLSAPSICFAAGSVAAATGRSLCVAGLAHGNEPMSTPELVRIMNPCAAHYLALSRGRPSGLAGWPWTVPLLSINLVSVMRVDS